MADDAAGFRPRRFGGVDDGGTALGRQAARLAAWLAKAAGAERTRSAVGDAGKGSLCNRTIPWWAQTYMSVLAGALNQRPRGRTPAEPRTRRRRR